ncbi:MAG: hypothetical protein ACI8UG_000123 [Gammaproteobacteria bacterium]|jgi:hypothetical protein
MFNKYGNLSFQITCILIHAFKLRHIDNVSTHHGKQTDNLKNYRF